jgi:hypothetical protein
MNVTEMHTTSSISFSFFFLALPLLAGIAGLIAMLFFKRTRPFGVVLLSLTGMLGLGIFWVAGSYHDFRVVESRAATEAADDQQIARVNAQYYRSTRNKNLYKNRKQPANSRAIDESQAAWLKSLDVESWYRDDSHSGDVRTKAVSMPASAPSNPIVTAKKAEAEPATVVGPTAKLFEAMGHALGKSLIEATVADKDKTASAAKKAAPPPATKPAPPVTKNPAPPPVTKPAPPAKKPPPPVVENPEAKSPRDASAPLPDWANKPPRNAGNGIYMMSIVVGPWQTRQECDAHLPEELQKALDQYAEKCLGRPASRRIVLPSDYLRQMLVSEEYEQNIQSSVGPMKLLHVLLAFRSDMKDRVIQEDHRGLVVNRLWTVGSGLAVVLWPMAVIYVYLKIDLATGGKYRGRLRFALLLAILAPIAAALAVMA